MAERRHLLSSRGRQEVFRAEGGESRRQEGAEPPKKNLPAFWPGGLVRPTGVEPVFWLILAEISVLRLKIPRKIERFDLLYRTEIAGQRK